MAQGYADKLTCTLDHDPKPWLVEGGMAVGGRSIPGGGAASGRQSLAPRPEFCTQRSHYWLYDHFTVPDFIEPEPTAPEGASS